MSGMIPIERFDAGFQDVLSRVVEELRQWKHSACEPEHLLLALTNNPDGERLLKSLGATVQEIRCEVTEWLDLQHKVMSSPMPSDQLYFTERARVVIDRATSLSDQRGDKQISVRSLLESLCLTASKSLSAHVAADGSQPLFEGLCLAVSKSLSAQGITYERIGHVLDDKPLVTWDGNWTDREVAFMRFYRWVSDREERTPVIPMSVCMALVGDRLRVH
jgi:hypothetical protein